LATVSIAIIAWLIAFVSQVLADSDNGINDFPKFAWWTIAYELFCVLSVALVVALDSVHKYHVAIVGSLAAGLVFTCSAVNQFVYSEDATMEAAGAGHILLSILQIVWIFYYGSATESISHATSSSHHPQMYTSAQLNGFETSSPVPGQHHDYRNSLAKYASPHPTTPTPGPSTTPQPSSQAIVEPEVAPPAEYPYKAKAIYSYDANPEDVNEITFCKHEILEVSDVSGRWWQARKPNGETGIAPSNYLILL
jgi:SHO1 osmosensor